MIDPVLFSYPIAPTWGFLIFEIRWYTLAYVFAFAFIGYRIKLEIHQHGLSLTPAKILSLIARSALAMLVGARVFYVLVYNPTYYFAHPAKILALHEGGLAFHGGLLGIAWALWRFSKRQRLNFWQLTDVVARWVPIGLALGRLGNFVNGELWGRPSSLPWAVIFADADNLPRHPSQLYEAVLEGPILWLLIYFFARQKHPGHATAIFLISYSCMRFVAEFFREPDAQLGLWWNLISMGQWLSLLTALLGAVLLIRFQNAAQPQQNSGENPRY